MMLLGLILSIMSATFTVATTTSVEASGEIPEGASFHYARSAESGQKGQMTAGNSTCLTLAGWDACTIKSISLQMRSNTNSGTGSLLVSIGSTSVWSIHNLPFSNEQWNGSYSSEWVDIQHSFEYQVQPDDKIEIILSATANSLYIKSYTITYEPAAPTPYTVAFITGFDSVPPAITQSHIGEPIVLPEWQDTVDWYFLGWSTVEVEESMQCPDILPAASLFTPTQNTRLWAIYTDNNSGYSVLEYTSGEYVLAQFNDLTQGVSGEGMGWAMNSKVYNGQVSIKPLALSLSDSLLQLQQDLSYDLGYRVNFLSDSTLTIRHIKSDEYIGYQASNLLGKECVWMYRRLNDSSLGIYYTYNQKTYALMYGFGPQGASSTAIAYAQQITLDAWIAGGLWLFPAVVSTYTSWPCGKWNALEKTEVTPPLSSDYIMQFGAYRLCIQNGKKYLLLAQ